MAADTEEKSLKSSRLTLTSDFDFNRRQKTLLHTILDLDLRTQALAVVEGTEIPRRGTIATPRTLSAALDSKPGGLALAIRGN